MSEELSEEDLRRLEAEMERITVDDVLLQTTVTLLNLAARRAGLANPPGEGPPPGWEQVRQAIDGARALLPLLEPRHGAELGPVRETLSRLQMIYAQAHGAAGGTLAQPPGHEAPAPAPDAPAQPEGPARRSRRAASGSPATDAAPAFLGGNVRLDTDVEPVPGRPRLGGNVRLDTLSSRTDRLTPL